MAAALVACIRSSVFRVGFGKGLQNHMQHTGVPVTALLQIVKKNSSVCFKTHNHQIWFPEKNRYWLTWN